MTKFHVNRDLLIVLLSLAIQIPLAIFLGHAYDETSFMDTGYLVSAGLNPYHQHFVAVFAPNMLGLNPVIGDPPLWPLLLGLIYRLTYSGVPNIFLYDFATKIPIIISNIGLAYIIRNILRRQGASEGKVRFAWLFLLFNPFLLLTSVAWGQFDTLIALLCVSSLFLLSQGKVKASAVLLSLSVVLKPIAFPLLGLPLFFTPQRSRKNALQYILISALVVVALWFLPFFILGWALPASTSQFSSFFKRAGGMTPFNVVEILSNHVTIPSGLQFLGYLWIPALLIGYYVVYRNPPQTFGDLTRKSVGVILIFFLTYSWLSEPYVDVVIALSLLALPVVKTNFRSFRNFHFLWITSLAFMIVTTNFFQLFYLVSPTSWVNAATLLECNIRDWRLLARFLIVVVWQIFAWVLVVEMLSHRENKKLDPSIPGDLG